MNYAKRLVLFLGVMCLYTIVLFTLLVWDLGKNKLKAETVQSEPEAEVSWEEPTQLPKPKGPENSKRLSWWYKGTKDHTPSQINEEFDFLIKKYGGIWQGDTNEKYIYLTFDEGYENGYTASILDTLREKKVTAAFFISGSYLRKNSDLVRRMLAEGHIVGNHSQNHKSMPLLTEVELEEEILGLAREFKKLTGTEIAPYFRPPMGEFDEKSLWFTYQKGYYSVFWSFAYRDWEVDNQKGKDYALEVVMANYHPGAVLLLHAVSRDNAAALPEIIEGLRGQGYEFLPLSSLRGKSVSSLTN